MTTDNTQAELRKLDSFRAINKLMIDAEIKVGHREQHIDYIIQEVLDWHNKQVEEVLDRVEKEVIGDEIPSDFDHDAGFCQNCDFQPTDGTENCICKIVNMARFKQRQSLATLRKELDGGGDE